MDPPRRTRWKTARRADAVSSRCGGAGRHRAVAVVWIGPSAGASAFARRRSEMVTALFCSSS